MKVSARPAGEWPHGHSNWKSLFPTAPKFSLGAHKQRYARLSLRTSNGRLYRRRARGHVSEKLNGDLIQPHVAAQ